MKAEKIQALTLVWLRDTPYDAGTEFKVVDVVDAAAKSPVQIDRGTADLWLRQTKAAPANEAGKGS